MITEDYVSFEIAKLLKEKGFNESCHATYDTAVTGGKPKFSEYEVLSFFPYGMRNTDDKYSMVISAPTQSVAMKWLREVHNIVIVIEPHTYNYINEKNSSYVFAIWEGDNYIEIYSYKNSGLRGISYPTYEEAVEASLKYCLENLI